VEELRSRRPGGGPSTAGAEGAAAVQRQRGTASGQEELGEAAGDLPREERPVWALRETRSEWQRCCGQVWRRLE
jgi:hypothetical protein